jgi:hypothetical protein
MSYRILSLVFLTAWFAAATPARSAQAQGAPAATLQRLVLDMVYNNPGEKPTQSAFNDPRRLADWGYTGQVVDSLVEGISTFDALDPRLVPAGSKERHRSRLPTPRAKNVTPGCRCWCCPRR